MTPVMIRRATVEDLQSVTELWKKMMQYHLSFDPRFDLAYHSDETYQKYLISILNNYDYAVFVADLDGELVGYTIGMILSNPPVFSLERYGFISEMAVTETQQRHGVGRMLWNHVQRWFHRRGITVIQLNVSPSNKRGYNFWKKVGCNEFLHILWHDIPRNLPKNAD